MRYFFVLLLFMSTLFGEKTITIATYNVDNLFDLVKDGYEYKEYIPFTKSNYNTRTYGIKLKNISRVIKDIDADIIALQEIESLVALKDLRLRLKRDGVYYPYYKIADKKNTTVKVALLSKIPFLYAKELSVGYSYKYRNILEVKFAVHGIEFYLFINHWKSKSGAESHRIVSAKVLKKRISEIGFDKNIILLGDFNSHYEEYKVFKRSRKHNNTAGKTGINHILKTLKQTKQASKIEYRKNNFYNLWYDVSLQERFSYIYRGKKDVLDNMLISQSLLKKQDMYYVYNSYHSLQSSYLFKKNRIYNWQITRKTKRHKGKGYSDHLPTVAKFIIL